MLFKPFDMHRAHAVLDIGCGYATDLLTLAAAYPQLQLRGCNISPEQVAAGRRRVDECGLAARIKIVEADSRDDAIGKATEQFLAAAAAAGLPAAPVVRTEAVSETEEDDLP